MTPKDFARDGASGRDHAIPVTAAVCTRDRPEALRRALASLVGQAVPPAEIVVVDNGTNPRTREVVAEYAGVRYVHERRAGLDVARNTALAQAFSPVVAFLDDDAVADRDWAAQLWSAFWDARVGVCAGRVEALSLDEPGQRLFEHNGGFSRGHRRIVLPRDARLWLHGLPAPLIAWAVSIGSGASLAVRREAALGLGGFDERLDDGGALPGGGDHDLMWRMLEADHHVVYQPDALAWHEHRADERDAIVQIAGHQRALVAFLVKTLARSRLAAAAPIAAFLAWRLLKPGARLLRRAAGRDPLPAATLLSLWVACWRGLTSYPLRAVRRAAASAHVTAG